MAVDVTTSPRFTSATPRLLFKGAGVVSGRIEYGRVFGCESRRANLRVVYASVSNRDYAEAALSA
jgi:hypothetical protein